jgi:GDP-L-fucose synthase
MRVFVPGGKGLVGSAVIRNAPLNVEIFAPKRDELDLTNRLAVTQYLLTNQIDSTIMAAAKVGGILANSKNQWSFLLENLKIQNAIFESAIQAKIPKLIFLGSSCIYPKFAQQPIKEECLLSGPLEPTNEGYALAKIAGVKMCMSLSSEFGYDYIALMPTNLYGINDNFDLETSHAPAALMRRMHEAKVNRTPNVTIWGSGNVYREFLSSNDLAGACWHFLNSDSAGELINIGTGIDISIRDFSYLMAQVVGYEGELFFDSSRPDGPPRKLLDTSKARSLGWTSAVELGRGLSDTYTWFKKAYQEREIRGY